MRACDVEIKPDFVRPGFLRPQMPFSNTCRRVPYGLQLFCQIREFGQQTHRPIRDAHFCEGPVVSGNPVGYMQPGRVLACEDAGSGGGAHRASGVSVGEAHPLGSQSVNMGCFVVVTSKATKIRPTQIIGEDENNVRFLGGLSSP